MIWLKLIRLAGSRILGTTGATLLPGGYGGTRDGNPRVIVPKDAIVTRGAHEPSVVLCEPIDAEFLVVAKCQLANHCAQRHLRRFDVHFVEDLFHLHDHFAIAKDDD